VSAGADFSRLEMSVAAIVALAVESGSVLMLHSEGGTPLSADISDDRAKPMAVAIVPVVDDDLPLLKLGTKSQPGKLPDRWLAPRPVARAAPGAFPSPLAKAVPEAIPDVPVPTANAVPPSPSTEPAKQVDLATPGAAGPEPVSATLGSPDGVKQGTETDALKAHAVSLYKVQLDNWFSARFVIRGKIPFETLKTLRARVTVSITAQRTVGSFTITSPSGNPAFDDVVRSTMQNIQSSQAELPPPPPLYPDILGTTRPFVFSCVNRSRCQ
jgi:hypothetical protein